MPLPPKQSRTVAGIGSALWSFGVSVTDRERASRPSRSCGQLFDSVLGEPPPDENAIADRVTSIAEHVGDGLWIDSLSYASAKILSHVH